MDLTCRTVKIGSFVVRKMKIKLGLTRGQCTLNVGWNMLHMLNNHDIPRISTDYTKISESMTIMIVFSEPYFCTTALHSRGRHQQCALICYDVYAQSELLWMEIHLFYFINEEIPLNPTGWASYSHDSEVYSSQVHIQWHSELYKRT